MARTKAHIVQDRGVEITLAVILLLLGCVLLWDAFDNRDVDMPWFARWFAFW